MEKIVGKVFDIRPIYLVENTAGKYTLDISVKYIVENIVSLCLTKYLQVIFLKIASDYNVGKYRHIISENIPKI